MNVEPQLHAPMGCVSLRCTSRFFSVSALAGMLRDGDVLVTMGAGHIGAVAHALPARLGAEVRT